jgi:predicted metal-dependent peptidase
MTFEEKIKISQMLQRRHYAFRVFWDMARIEFSEKIPTMGVVFDRETFEPALLINEEFWNSFSDEGKMFLIMHECFHILFNHHQRFVKYYNTPYQEYMNIATDIVINEMLCDSFDFDKKKLDLRISEGAFIDNVFGEHADKIERNRDSDYYLKKLIEYFGEPPEQEGNDKGDGEEGEGEGQGGIGVERFDEHEIESEEDAKNLVEAVEQSGTVDMMDKEFKEKVENSDEFKEIENLSDAAGTGHGGWIKVNVGNVKVKRKWEAVIRNFTQKLYKTDFKLEDRWDRTKPLYHEIMKANPDVKIPSASFIIGEVEEEEKSLVYMFLDCSGSCINLKDRFFKAARTVDLRKIDLRLFSFDDRVTELDIRKAEVNGGWGTRFDIIENEIQRIMTTEKKKYPDQVFIITDGYGSSVQPQKPERWIWFLTENGDDCYIDKKSKTFHLSEFE